MIIVFDITNISRFHINYGNQYDYCLELRLKVGTYYESEFQQSVGSSLKQYFSKLLKNDDYSSVIISSNGDISRIKFLRSGIKLEIDMSNEKLLKLYEEVKRTDLNDKFLKVKLSEDELSNLSTIDDDIDRFIYFTDYTFEFVH